ncbi:MAG: hypothetical protein ACRD3L_17580 [Terriglobales bacterium]
MHGDKPPRDWNDFIVLGVLLAISSVVLMFIDSAATVRRLLARQQHVEQVEREFAGQAEIQDEIELLVKSSPAASSNVTSRTLTTDAAELRDQITFLAQRFEQNRNEIVEIQRIDPVLEATLKLSVENLAKRLDAIEGQLLTKWDVALVFLALIGGLSAVLGALFSFLKYLQK